MDDIVREDGQVVMAGAQLANHMNIELVQEGLQLDTIGAVLIPVPSTAPPGTEEAFTVEGSEYMLLRGATAVAETTFGAVWRTDGSPLSNVIDLPAFSQLGLYAHSANEAATTLPSAGTASYEGGVVARSRSLAAGAPAPMSHQGTITIEADWSPASATGVDIDMSLPARSGSGMTVFDLDGGQLTPGSDALAIAGATAGTINYAGTDVTVTTANTDVQMQFVAGSTDTPVGVIGYFRVRDSGQTGSMELEWAGAFGADDSGQIPAPNMQTVMLGASGETLVLTQGTDGMWRDADMTVWSDGDTVTDVGQFKLMYLLTTDSGDPAMPWMATHQERTFDLRLGNSGTTLNLAQAEAGTWTDRTDSDNVVPIATGDVVVAGSGARYRVTLLTILLEWRHAFEPRMQTLALGGSGFSLSLQELEDGTWRDMDGFGGLVLTRGVMSTHTTGNGLEYLLTDDSGNEEMPWAAMYQQKVQMAMLEDTDDTYTVRQRETGIWEDPDMMPLSEGDSREVNGTNYVFTMPGGMWMGALQSVRALAGTHLSNHMDFRLGDGDMLLLNVGGSMALDLTGVTAGTQTTIMDADDTPLFEVITGETGGAAMATFGVFWRPNGADIRDDVDLRDVYSGSSNDNLWGEAGLFAHSPLTEMTLPPVTGLATFQGEAVAISQRDAFSFGSLLRESHVGTVTVEMRWSPSSSTQVDFSMLLPPPPLLLDPMGGMVEFSVRNAFLSEGRDQLDISTGILNNLITGNDYGQSGRRLDNNELDLWMKIVASSDGSPGGLLGNFRFYEEGEAGIQWYGAFGADLVSESFPGNNVANHPGFNFLAETKMLELRSHPESPLLATLDLSMVQPGTVTDVIASDGTTYRVLTGTDDGAMATFGAFWLASGDPVLAGVDLDEFNQAGLFANSSLPFSIRHPGLFSIGGEIQLGSAVYDGTAVARSSVCGRDGCTPTGKTHLGTVNLTATWRSADESLIDATIELANGNLTDTEALRYRGFYSFRVGESLPVDLDQYEWNGFEGQTSVSNSTEQYLVAILHLVWLGGSRESAAGEPAAPAGVIGFFSGADASDEEYVYAGAFGAGLTPPEPTSP